MKTDLLKYDASSLQELLMRKLIDSGLYEDQIYPGSDTRILIDLFSWTFNILTYILNNNAANAIFDDAEVYENLNKIVKLLSYKPHSYKTSYCEFLLSYLDFSTKSTSFACTIPKFASINTGKTDKWGNEIYYSFVKNYTFKITNGVVSTDENPVLYNGRFMRYTFDGMTQGREYELFIMSGISPNNNHPQYVDTEGISVFYEKIDNNGVQTFKEIKIVDNLILDAGPNDLVCEMRLNENYELTFKFGNNIHGKTLDEGGTLHVVYLVSNCDEGIIDSGEINTSEISLKVGNISSLSELIKMCYGGIEDFLLNYGTIFSKNNLPLVSTNSLNIANITNSSGVLEYETVEEIKNNAPSTFRIGNRLVTSSDFRTYILTMFPSIIDDVYVCNNVEYCTGFYKWLDKYDSFDISIRAENYKYANACDFNNVYLWLKPKYDGEITKIDKNNILSKCENIKQLTINLVPCNAIKTYVTPFIKYKSFDITELTESIFSSSYISPVKIFIIKNGENISNGTVKVNVSNIIVNYFKNINLLGGKISVQEILNEIYALGYVEDIKTVLVSDKADGELIYENGLSFISFTESLVEFQDYEIFNNSKQFEKFQYPELLNKDSFVSLIEVVNDTSYILKNKEF